MKRLWAAIFFCGGFFIFAARAWCGDPSPINIDFASSKESPKSGPAVVGSRSDFWNPVHPAEGLNYQTDAEMIGDRTRGGLKYADGRPSGAAVRMVNLGGGYTGTYGINDPMFASFNYQYDVYRGNNGRPAYLYLFDLKPGKYDLYLYAPLGRFEVLVAGKTYGRKDNTQDEGLLGSAEKWTEGVHYRRFSDLIVKSGDQIKINLIPSNNRTHDAPISGLQIVPAGTPLVDGVILQKEPQAAENPSDACSGGCRLSGACVPIGYRTDSGYCDVGAGAFYPLKADGGRCNNSFECLSSACAAGQCRPYGPR